MKKLLFTLLAVVATAFVFSACSSSSDDTPNLSDVAAGTYAVSLMVNLDQNGEISTEGPVDATVVITRATDTSVNFELQGFELTEGFEIPVAMEGISISGTSAAIEIAETTKTVTIAELEDMGVDSEVNVTVSGTIVNQSTLALNISLPISMTIGTITIPMNVTVEATGVKQ